MRATLIDQLLQVRTVGHVKRSVSNCGNTLHWKAFDNLVRQGYLKKVNGMAGRGFTSREVVGVLTDKGKLAIDAA